MEISILHQLFLKYPYISTDTRNIIENSIFFALKGDNFDANTLVDDAFNKGARYVVMDNKKFYREEDEQMILVDNVLKTLQELAHYHRTFLNIPIIGLTGSNGKTTTKELIHAVLSQKYNTVATKGNLNNHIGVPLTLLSMNTNTEIGIVEMGANHHGEIKALCEIAVPNFGYITNFGKAHLEGFGSIEGVIKAKSELYDFINKHKGVVFVNSSDENQIKKSLGIKQVYLEELEILENPTNYISFDYNDKTVHTHLVGNYNLTNIAAAVSIGKYFGVENAAIRDAITNYLPDNKRSQLIDKGNCKIILDAYNANPTSMQAALENFAKNGTTNKVLILGDMFELGEHSEVEHQKIAQLITDLKFEKVCLIGERFYKTEIVSANKFSTFDDFKNGFQKKGFENKTILIKGSRGMALERVLELF